MKQVFFIFLRSIDYASLPNLQIIQGAPVKFQRSIREKSLGTNPCYRQKDPPGFEPGIVDCAVRCFFTRLSIFKIQNT